MTFPLFFFFFFFFSVRQTFFPLSFYPHSLSLSLYYSTLLSLPRSVSVCYARKYYIYIPRTQQQEYRSIRVALSLDGADFEISLRRDRATLSMMEEDSRSQLSPFAPCPLRVASSSNSTLLMQFSFPVASSSSVRERTCVRACVHACICVCVRCLAHRRIASVFGYEEHLTFPCAGIVVVVVVVVVQACVPGSVPSLSTPTTTISLLQRGG